MSILNHMKHYDGLHDQVTRIIPRTSDIMASMITVVVDDSLDD
jgi:hypothetical protein